MYWESIDSCLEPELMERVVFTSMANLGDVLSKLIADAQRRQDLSAAVCHLCNEGDPTDQRGCCGVAAHHKCIKAILANTLKCPVCFETVVFHPQHLVYDDYILDFDPITLVTHMELNSPYHTLDTDKLDHDVFRFFELMITEKIRQVKYRDAACVVLSWVMYMKRYKAKGLLTAETPLLLKFNQKATDLMNVLAPGWIADLIKEMTQQLNSPADTSAEPLSR